MRYHAHDHTSGEGPLYQWRFKSIPRLDDEHFLTVCRYVEPNALRVEWVSRAEQWRCGSLWRSAQNAETNPALLTSWPISRPRGGITRVNPPLTEKGLRPFYERLPFILYNVAIIAQRDVARSRDDDRFKLASNEFRSAFL